MSPAAAETTKYSPDISVEALAGIRSTATMHTTIAATATHRRSNLLLIWVSPLYQAGGNRLPRGTHFRRAKRRALRQASLGFCDACTFRRRTRRAAQGICAVVTSGQGRAEILPVR